MKQFINMIKEDPVYLIEDFVSLFTEEDIQLLNKKETTCPSFYAAFYKREDLFHFLFDYGFKPDSMYSDDFKAYNNYSYIHYVVLLNNISALKKALTHKNIGHINHNVRGLSPTSLAIKYNYLEIVDYILSNFNESEIELDNRVFIPFIYCLEHNFNEMAILLLKKRNRLFFRNSDFTFSICQTISLKLSENHNILYELFNKYNNDIPEYEQNIYDHIFLAILKNANVFHYNITNILNIISKSNYEVSDKLLYFCEHNRFSFSFEHFIKECLENSLSDNVLFQILKSEAFFNNPDKTKLFSTLSIYQILLFHDEDDIESTDYLNACDFIEVLCKYNIEADYVFNEVTNESLISIILTRRLNKIFDIFFDNSLIKDDSCKQYHLKSYGYSIMNYAVYTNNVHCYKKLLSIGFDPLDGHQNIKNNNLCLLYKTQYYQDYQFRNLEDSYFFNNSKFTQDYCYILKSLLKHGLDPYSKIKNDLSFYDIFKNIDIVRSIIADNERENINSKISSNLNVNTCNKKRI